MLTKRYQTDCAMPIPCLMGPGSEPGCLAVAPVGALKNKLPLDFARWALVDFLAKRERIHVEFDSELRRWSARKRNIPADVPAHGRPHLDPR